MYRKWMAALVLFTGMTAAAQTTEKEKTEKEPKEKISKKLSIVVDGEKVTINGKDIKEMSPEEMEKLGDMDMLKLSPGLRMMIPGRGGANFFKLDDLRKGGKERALLGVMSEKHEKGAKITSVTSESGASKAGLQKDDIITKVNDVTITGSEDLYETIGKYKPEDKVTIHYLRDGKENTTTATLGKTMEMDFDFDFGDSFNRNFNFDEMPNKFRNRIPFSLNYSSKPKLGISIEDTENSKGVKVTDVDDDAPADKAGIKTDDIITSINGKAVNAVDEIKEALKDLKEGDIVKAGITRAGKSQVIEIKLPKKLKTADL